MLRELQNEIDRYLVGRSTLRQLESWLISHLQAVLESGDETLTEIANAIDADLIEYGEGLLSDADLRRHLDAYLRRVETIVLNANRKDKVATTSAAGSTIILSDLEMPEHITTIRLPTLVVA